MAIVPSWSVTQSLADPDNITFTDTSTGTDATITQRRVYIQLANQTYLVEEGTTTDYEVWSNFPGTTTLTLDVLSRSQAATVTVQWLTAAGVIVHTVTEEVDFNLYDYIFMLEMLQNVTSDSKLLSDTNFWTSMIKYIVDIFNSENAIEQGSDVYSAQQALDRNYHLEQNQQYYF